MRSTGPSATLRFRPRCQADGATPTRSAGPSPREVVDVALAHAEVHPSEVHPSEVPSLNALDWFIGSWFIGSHVDALDWVMVPNVMGMSQYADDCTRILGRAALDLEAFRAGQLYSRTHPRARAHGVRASM